RYGLFFPEKLTFFLEGSENFNLSASGTVQVVHTRTIVNPLVGLKLSGKVGERSRIASIYAIDELLAPEPGRSGTRAHFPIVRYKYALGDESYVGAILTGRELENSFNRVAGADASIRMTGSSTFDTQALFSQSKATDIADRTDGHSISLEYNHGSRDIDFVIGTNKVSENFSSETGYVTRTGILSFNAFARPKFYPESDFLRRVDVLFSTNGARDELSSLWETSNEVAVINIFSGGQSSRFSYFHSTEIFLGERFRTDGFLVSGGGQFTNEVNLSLQYRRANAIFFSATPYQGRGSRATASLVFQPWNQLEINSSITYVDFFRSSDNEKIYDYPLGRLKLTYQLNKYLFVRGIAEYNKFNRALLNDFLASFTYIPGTVIHVGYGSQYKRTRWESGSYVNDDDFFETRRGFFFKMSYLWRS
ncbi:MAG: Carb-bd dom fam9 domain-containing protein, partial [Bacteroidetes bacterium]|nr:Carb-bd dom fam9 domain-containing protein [Bacteroidota bacterium]